MTTPADIARTAGHITSQEIAPMHMTHRDYAPDESAGAWKREPAGMATFIIAALTVVLLSLIAGHVVAKGIANLAHYTWEIDQ